MVLSLSLFLRIFRNRLVAGSRFCWFNNNEAFISSISNTVICAFVLSANISSIGRWMLTMSIIGHVRFRNVGLFLDSNVLLDNTCLALFERTPCFFRKKTWMCCDRRWELLYEGLLQGLGVRLESKLTSAGRFSSKRTLMWLHTCFFLENAFLKWAPSFSTTLTLLVSGLTSCRAFLSLRPMMDARGKRYPKSNSGMDEGGKTKWHNLAPEMC